MERTVLKELIEWKERADRKPLILNGARQVGKTWLLHEFARLEYKKGRVNSMLALTRKKGESLVINNDIEITILEIRGDQIKLGVSAPKEVPIYRKEVYTQIQQENRKSADAQNAQALKELFG